MLWVQKVVVPTFLVLSENTAQTLQFRNERKYMYVGSDVRISAVSDQNYNQSRFCEISGSHSGVTEDPSRLGCDAVCLGK